MIDSCGCFGKGRGSLLAFFIFSLTISATLAIAAAAAFLFFSTLGASGVVWTPILLTIAIVLMTIIVLLLLLLLWCCCKGKGDLGDLSRLLKLLPTFRNAGAALETTAVALNGMATALRAAKLPVTAAGDAAYTAGEKADVSVPTVSASKRNLAGFGDVVVGLNLGTTSPLHETSEKLKTVANSLRGPDSLSANLGDSADRCDQAAAGLRALKNVLDAL